MARSAYDRSNRRFENGENGNEKNGVNWCFCFGDSASINSYLKNKNGCLWILPKFLNAFFRGIGQVVFANNPFSGILILTVIIWFNLTVGLVVLGSTIIAILTAVLINIHPKSIIAGHVLFNAVLFSSVTSSLWSPLYKEPLSVTGYIFIGIGSAFSVLISNSLSNILSSCKPTIPIISIPFHILVFTTFACLKPDKNEFSALSSNIQYNPLRHNILYNRTLMVPESEDFFTSLNGTVGDEFYSCGTLQNVALGVALSSGQVFGIADFVTSLIIFAAILIYSPILAFMCLHGAVISTVLGLFLTPFPNDEIFLGVWGFNGLLSCGAIGVFYIFNWYSFLNGTINAIFTTVLQFLLTPYFTAYNLPVFGLPFVLSTLLFVCVTSNGDQLVRVKTVTFPEHQRRSYFLKKVRDEVMTERNLMDA